MQAILLFAHGSSLPVWRIPFDRLLESLQAKHPKALTALGFLERTQPDFRGAVEKLLAMHDPHFREHAATISLDIQVVPLFLAKSVHTERDIVQCIANVLDDYPSLNFSVAESILEDDTMLAFLENALSKKYFSSTP